MKKLILIFLAVISLLTFTFLSCKKNKESKDSITIDFAQKSDIAKANIVSTDKDWQVIASKT